MHYSMDGSRKGAKSTIYYTVEYSLSLYVAQSTVLFFHSVASVLYCTMLERRQAHSNLWRTRSHSVPVIVPLQGVGRFRCLR